MIHTALLRGKLTQTDPRDALRYAHRDIYKAGLRRLHPHNRH